MSKAFKEALELVSRIPPAPDIIERMTKLEEQIDPKEKDLFGDLWEAVWAALDEPPIPRRPES